MEKFSKIQNRPRSNWTRVLVLIIQVRDLLHVRRIVRIRRKQKIIHFASFHKKKKKRSCRYALDRNHSCNAQFQMYFNSFPFRSAGDLGIRSTEKLITIGDVSPGHSLGYFQSFSVRVGRRINLYGDAFHARVWIFFSFFFFFVCQHVSDFDDTHSNKLYDSRRRSFQSSGIL